jgi:hypothetical protein
MLWFLKLPKENGEPVSRRRHHAISAIAIAVSIGFVPCAAFASSGPSSPSAAHAHSSADPASKTFAKAMSSGVKTSTSKSSGSLVHHVTSTMRAATAGTTIYVGNANECLFSNPRTDPGSGTVANPFCAIQDALNVAVPGDTISVAFGEGESYDSFGSVVVTTSDISIVGTGYGEPEVDPYYADSESPAVIIDGVSDVTVSHLTMKTTGTSAVEIIGSSKVTLDTDFIDAESGAERSTSPVVTIDGTSSDVTISRTTVTGGATNGAGISVATGASNIVLASNVLSLSGIEASGVDNLDITGNTIQRLCGSAVSIVGSSAGVFIENNLVEDSNPDVDPYITFATCSAPSGPGWAPDLTIAAAAVAGTTSDYNDFYSYGSDNTAPYSWDGVTYPTISAFEVSTGQGTHDLNDTVETRPINFSVLDYNFFGEADALLVTGSAAIDSANTDAPGELSSDYLGDAPYDSRGAIQFSNDNLSVTLSVASYTALSANVDADGTGEQAVATYSYDWGDGATTSYGGPDPIHKYAVPGTYTITVTVTDDLGYTISTSAAVTTLGSDFTAYGPTRLLDTRFGTGAAKAQVKGQGTLKLEVVGAGVTGDLIPAGVTAVVLNVTVTNAHGSGFITVYDDGDPNGVPTSSNVNYVAGQTVPNLVVVPVGQDGDVDLFNGGDKAGAVDLIADVTGYFTQSAAAGYTSLTPDRLIDTRFGAGIAKAQIGAGASFVVPIAGNDGGLLPASGITAVALNVTVTNPKGSGFLTVYPDGVATPNASNVNYGPGQTVADSVIAPVAGDGKIDVFNGGDAAKATDVIVDVVGYYSPTSASAYVPVFPERYIDTRSGINIAPGQLPNGTYIYAPLGIDTPNVTGFVFNTTVTDTAGSGFLTVSPDPNTAQDYDNPNPPVITPPNSSNLNWTKGETVPNLVQASTGANGIIDFWNLGDNGGNIDLIVDVFGYYQND